MLSGEKKKRQQGLGRALDPHANGAWQSMDRKLTRRVRREGREARGNEEREKRED